MASRSRLHLASLAAMAVVAWAAVLTQIYLTVVTFKTGEPVVTRLLYAVSYFTIHVNLLVAAISTVSFFRGDGNSFLTRTGTKAAATVYIVIVALVYAVLLRGIEELSGLRIVTDFVLHKLMPVAYVLYWLAYVPKGSLRWSQPVWWLVYPALYFAYVLLRGAVTGEYLYYTLSDVNVLGWPTVLRNLILFVAGFYAVGLAVAAVDRTIGRFARHSEVQAKN